MYRKIYFIIGIILSLIILILAQYIGLKGGGPIPLRTFSEFILYVKENYISILIVTLILSYFLGYALSLEVEDYKNKIKGKGTECDEKDD